MPREEPLDTFGLEEGDSLVAKYLVLGLLGAGWEGEVYLVREQLTGVNRAAKIFFPQRNPKNRAVKAFAKKLHRLRDCPAVMQYVGHEETFLAGRMVTVLVSELVAGEPLSEFLARQPQRRLEIFAALHLLRALAGAVSELHKHGEYHGDLHSENVLIERIGLRFSVQLLDLARAGRRTSDLVADDVVDLIRLFGEAIGGTKRAALLPPAVRALCGSFRRDRIISRIRTPQQLVDEIDQLEWE